MVGQGEGERSFEKVTCTNYDVMITSEFKLQGNGVLGTVAPRAEIICGSFA